MTEGQLLSCLFDLFETKPNYTLMELIRETNSSKVILERDHRLLNSTENEDFHYLDFFVILEYAVESDLKDL